MIALVLLAVAAGLWAGLLALAEDSPQTPGELGEGRFRLIIIGRLALLAVAGVAAGAAVQWWLRPVGNSIVALLVAGGFLFMIAEALPRAAAGLAPELSSAAASVAARSVVVWAWLAAPARLGESMMDRTLPRKLTLPGNDPPPQRDMLLGLFSLRDTTVAEIMTPRLDVDALELSVDWNGVIEHVRRSEHARIPVYTESRDRIEGILYAKDLVAAVVGELDRPARWQDLIRPAEFVPESKRLTDQLRDFQRGPAHLAVVVDEFGGTSGIVTLEDTLEEIVGEIHDEYDADERPAVEREGDDKFWVDGAVTVDELEALLGLPVETEDVTTVGGLVYATLGRVPEPGESFEYGAFKVIVEQVVRRRIHRVYFERQPAPPVESE